MTTERLNRPDPYSVVSLTPLHVPRRDRFHAREFVRFPNVTQGVIQDLNRSEEHTSELQSLMRISNAVFCLKKKKHIKNTTTVQTNYSNINYCHTTNMKDHAVVDHNHLN